MPPLSFKKLTVSDIEELGRFFTRNNLSEVTHFFHPFPLTHESAESILTKSKLDLYFALIREGSIVAFSMLRGYDEGYADSSFGIIVDHCKSSQGLGTRLTQMTLDYVDEKRLGEIRLSVYANNQAALRIYEKLGFKISKREPAKNGSEKVTMIREAFKPTVFASTACLTNGGSLSSKINDMVDAGIKNIECGFTPNLKETDLEALKACEAAQFALHSYFPSYDNDLVINLASTNKSIAARSIDACKASIDLSRELNARWYSFHAGFIGDPIGRDAYGFRFKEPSQEEKDQALEAMIANTRELLDYAKERAIALLVENNVCTTTNKGAPLLVTPSDFSDFLKRDQGLDELQILLDVGHLNVSSKTYGFDIGSFISLKERVRGIHLHENDGSADQHTPATPESPLSNFSDHFDPSFITLEGKHDDANHLNRNIASFSHENV